MAMIRKTALLIARASVALLLIAALNDSPATAQSTPAQEKQTTKAKDSEDQAFINADRPGIADGSSVIPARWIQIESGVQREFRREDDVREHTLFIPTLFRVGVTSRWELRVEGNTFTRTTEFDSTDVNRRTSGFAPVSLGVKYQIEASDGRAHPGIGTIVRIFPAWGTSDLRTHHATGDVRLAADWDFSKKLNLSLNPNVGVGVFEDDKGRAFVAELLAVTLNYVPSKTLNPFIDFGLQSPEEGAGRAALIVDGGVAIIIGHNVQLDASIGEGAHGHTPPHPFLSFGVSFRSHAFGQGK